MAFLIVIVIAIVIVIVIMFRVSSIQCHSIAFVRGDANPINVSALEGTESDSNVFLLAQTNFPSFRPATTSTQAPAEQEPT
jgi:hypothetical protein